MQLNTRKGGGEVSILKLSMGKVRESIFAKCLFAS